MVSEKAREQLLLNHHQNPRHGKDCKVCNPSKGRGWMMRMRTKLLSLLVAAIGLAAVFGGGSGLNAASHVLGGSGLN